MGGVGWDGEVVWWGIVVYVVGWVVLCCMG